MKIEQNKKIGITLITLRSGKVADTIQISPEVIIDVDAEGNILDLEILDVESEVTKRSLKRA